MNESAIHSYHELLENRHFVSSGIELLKDLQNERGLKFGDRELCTVLRPRFFDNKQYTYLCKSTESLLNPLKTIYNRGIQDINFRKQFCLTPDEEELCNIEPGFEDPSPTSRFDSFFTDVGQLKFTEFNAETPAGAAYTDALSELFYILPVFQEFQRNYHVYSLKSMPGIAHAILDTFYKWQGHKNLKPKVAILDWREVPTFSEFVLFYDYFTSIGIEVRNVDPRDVSYANGKLMAGDFEINMIYKRVLISELLQRGGLSHPVINAVRDGSVCMANSFRCKLLFKKCSFAILTDERNRDLFSSDELRTINDHVPWTRLLEARKTIYNDSEIDLIPWVMENKDQLVLKPNDDYGGNGIVLGWNVSESTWRTMVEQGLNTPYIVQERIMLPREYYPSIADTNVNFTSMITDSNPYVYNSSYVHGCLTRISPDDLVNVTAGTGSTVPTFIIEPR